MLFLVDPFFMHATDRCRQPYYGGCQSIRECINVGIMSSCGNCFAGYFLENDFCFGKLHIVYIGYLSFNSISISMPERFR